MMPSTIRKDAETDVPTMPPTRLKESNFELIADDVAATTTDVTMTIVEWPSEKKSPTVTGR